MFRMTALFFIVFAALEIEAAVGGMRYFRFIEIERAFADEKKHLYRFEFKPFKRLDHKPKLAEEAFIAEKLNELGERTGLAKIAPDWQLIWNASFYSDGRLKKFTQFRREDTRGRKEKEDPPYFEFQSTFLPNGQLSSEEAGENKTVYQYDPKEGFLLCERYFQRDLLKGSRYFIYKKNQLVRINTYGVEAYTKTEKPSGYLLIDSFPVSEIPHLKSIQAPLRCEVLSFYDENSRWYKDEILYYQDHKKRVRDLSDGSREIYHYGKETKEEPDATIVWRHASQKQPYKKVALYYYPPHLPKDEFILKPTPTRVKIMRTSSHAKDTDGSTEVFSRYDRRGQFFETLSLQREGQKLIKLSKKQLPSLNYHYLFDAKNRVVKKEIIDERKRALGHYAYEYDPSGRLVLETFYNARKIAFESIRYFYTKKDLPAARKENETKVFHQYHGEVFRFHFKSILQNIKSSLAKEKDRRRESEGMASLIRENANLIKQAHLQGLVKIIYYNAQGDVSSYLRIQSSEKGGFLTMKIDFFDRPIDFDFKYNKGEKNYLGKPFFYKKKNDKAFIDPSGHQWEFHNLAVDGVNKNQRRHHEPLSSSLTIRFDASGKVRGLDEKHYQVGTKKVISQIALNERGELVAKTPKNEIQKAETQYFKTLTSQTFKGSLSP